MDLTLETAEARDGRTLTNWPSPLPTAYQLPDRRKDGGLLYGTGARKLQVSLHTHTHTHTHTHVHGTSGYISENILLNKPETIIKILTLTLT